MSTSSDNNINNNNNSNRIIGDKEENNNEEICKCGDPNSHKYECALYCGQNPCDDKLVKLPECSHRIHEQCLENLLFTRLSKCPLCRSSIEQWRRSKHFHKIEHEISQQFQSDTDLAIRLSQESFEEEKRRKNESENDDMDRNNNDNRNHRNHRDNDRSLARNGRSNNRRDRFRSFFQSRSRSRSRSRNRNNTRHSR